MFGWHGSAEALTPESGANLDSWSHRKSKLRLRSTPTHVGPGAPPPAGRRFFRQPADVVWLYARPSGLTHAKTKTLTVSTIRRTSSHEYEAPP